MPESQHAPYEDPGTSSAKWYAVVYQCYHMHLCCSCYEEKRSIGFVSYDWTIVFLGEGFGVSVLVCYFTCTIYCKTIGLLNTALKMRKLNPAGDGNKHCTVLCKVKKSSCLYFHYLQFYLFFTYPN